VREKYCVEIFTADLFESKLHKKKLSEKKPKGVRARKKAHPTKWAFDYFNKMFPPTLKQAYWTYIFVYVQRHIA
jgi:hypothetical protein